MTLLKKLMLVLFLGMIVAGPATPIFKSLFGVGSTAAYAVEDDNNQGDNDDQGEPDDSQ
jgi:hypothetical protein